MYILIPLAALFIFKYYYYQDPPLADLISPSITLCLATLALNQSYLLVLSLVLDSVADFLMDSKKLFYPIVLFSLGHILKQLVFNPHPLLPLLSTLLFFDLWTRQRLIIDYTLIIALSFIQVYMIKYSLGYLCFAISDAIIGYELAITRISYRPIRVLLVPILYWLAEYLLVLGY